MKKASKKIIGGLMVVGLLATIGAVVVSASPGFFSDLTDDQKEGLRSLRQELRDEGATWEEMREAMREQLEEYGVEVPTQDEMLDMRIEQAEKRLQILKRTKELRQNNPELSWEEIRDIIQDEFDLEFPYGEYEGMKSRRGFHGRFHRGFCKSLPEEESE